MSWPPWSSPRRPCRNTSCPWPLRVADVRLLIDANLSPKVAAALRNVGLESVHVGDVGLLTAPDRGILDYAAANALVIVSADSDFGELLLNGDVVVLRPSADTGDKRRRPAQIPGRP